MIRGLGSVFYLAQAFVDVSGCLVDGLSKKFIGHKVGAGAGGKETAVLNQLHGS